MTIESGTGFELSLSVIFLERSNMFKRILVPIDFSSCSDSALQYAYHLTETFNSQLHLIFVREDLHFVFPDAGMPSDSTGEFLAHQTEIAADRLQALPLDRDRSGQDIVRRVLTGSPHAEIINYADGEKIELIVMGTHGRGGLMHLVMGSVAERVVQRAHCPVLTVRSPRPNSADNAAGENHGD